MRHPRRQARATLWCATSWIREELLVKRADESARLVPLSIGTAAATVQSSTWLRVNLLFARLVNAVQPQAAWREPTSPWLPSWGSYPASRWPTISRRMRRRIVLLLDSAPDH